ncbi:MAG TPA: phenylalanine--tRNA ligase subunit beta, partial [Pyrinomonadaceae bacterium]|nr:phenylalanine--tRNA ligase subunit beta [Pyrinomonadaceae bacterium]
VLMKISYKWLRELTPVALAPEELAERLTMVGLAVDAVEREGDDFVLEIDLTSNRPDCLSHLGVAREVAAITGAKVRLPDVETRKVEGRAADSTSVRIEAPELCPRYAARVVRGVKIGPSPAWLVERLTAIGQRPINNVADITNFVMHELGQPLHAFDLSTLAERRIVVRLAREGEKLKTLDGVERTLDSKMLVIADAARAVALAGVMGGAETEITDATTDVLIESAYFDPASVRRTAKVLGLHTEASYRFERGTDYEGVRRAQDRCVALITELAGGVATEDAVDVYPAPPQSQTVSFRPSRVVRLTGLDVPAEESARILSALGFGRADGDGDAATVSGAPSAGEASTRYVVPSWRVDVGLEEDLVEEVARHFGYDKVTDALPASGASGEYRRGEHGRRAAKRALAALGFDEAISFSFIDASAEGRFGLLPGVEEALARGDGEFVRLSNPVLDGVTLMRPTLLSGLLDAVRHNFNHGTRDVRLFEMGRVFCGGPADSELPYEREALALVLTGGAREEGRAEGPRALDFYDLKGALEAAADALNAGALEFEPADVKHLRAGQSARVRFGGNAIGTLGRLDDETAALYKFRQPVFVAEVDFASLVEAGEAPARYAPLARYPSVVRDVSLLAARSRTFAEMRGAVLALGFEELRGVTLVDSYEGEQLPADKRSLTLRAEYRADDRTLRDEEVDAMHARVVGVLGEQFGAQLRG